MTHPTIPHYVWDQLTGAERDRLSGLHSGGPLPALAPDQAVGLRVLAGNGGPVGRNHLRLRLTTTDVPATDEALEGTFDALGATLRGRCEIDVRPGDVTLSRADLEVELMAGDAVSIAWRTCTLFVAPRGGRPAARYEVPLEALLLLAAFMDGCGRFTTLERLRMRSGVDLRGGEFAKSLRTLRATLDDLIVTEPGIGMRLATPRTDLGR